MHEQQFSLNAFDILCTYIQRFVWESDHTFSWSIDQLTVNLFVNKIKIFIFHVTMLL